LYQPTLYILMRTDMASLNAGKAMAQAAHAANAFTQQNYHADGKSQWLCSQGFGTTIVLAVDSERELVEIINSAIEDGFPANVIVDTTYPLKDGATTHYFPVTTCGYVFTKCRQTKKISSLAGLDLHK
jgi:peptidyl-tRNA hydrolase